MHFEAKEAEPKLLFKIILMRHEETEYTNEGLDLTEQGIASAKETGKEIKRDDFFSPDEKTFAFSSPKPRALGTAGLVLNEAGLAEEPVRPVSVLGQSKILDEEAFAKHIEELEDNPARIAEAHYTHDFHQNHPEIIEPHLKKKERLYRALEYLTRGVLKSEHDDGAQPTQVFAVSHFELITHLIDDVFGIENTGYRSPMFGEQVRILAYATQEPEKILLKVSFRDSEKEVIFNRQTRSIE